MIVIILCTEKEILVYKLQNLKQLILFLTFQHHKSAKLFTDHLFQRMIASHFEGKHIYYLAN